MGSQNSEALIIANLAMHIARDHSNKQISLDLGLPEWFIKRVINNKLSGREPKLWRDQSEEIMKRVSIRDAHKSIHYLYLYGCC